MRAGKTLRVLTVLMAAVMLMTACPSFAETTATVEFDDFTLTTDEEIAYAPKGQGTMFTIHPFRNEGDEATNINCLYLGGMSFASFPADTYAEYMRTMEDDYRKQYEGIGMTVSSFRVLEPVEARAWGRNAYLLDILVDAGYLGTTYHFHQRQVVVFGDFGCYGFTCTSTDEGIDKTEESLYRVLSWK